MLKKTDFYIGGRWTVPVQQNEMHVVNPADEQPFATISMGSSADVDAAVSAARGAFETWGWTSPEERLPMLGKLVETYRRRMPEMAKAISSEMGAPLTLATEAQAMAGLEHMESAIRTLEAFVFEHPLDDANPQERIVYEPIGVCALITPWNWPMSQVSLKVTPALAAGCAVVLKPSEVAPLSSMLFAEIVDEAGFPDGVFNLVNGDGPTVGAALARHPGVDMVSFTGSTRVGVSVSRAAADTVKRVSLELGGKSPNIVFADSGLPDAIRRGVLQCFENTGQSCNAPSRMLVERSAYEQAKEIAAAAARDCRIGDPSKEGDHIGPLASRAQFEKVQEMIEAGVREGANLLAGGPGRPEGFNRGYFARPTVFADVTHGMRIAREEIFGPVLAMTPFDTEDEAVSIANDTPYGLSAYVQTADRQRAHRVARRLRSGMVRLNGAGRPSGSPFGGYKQSGNGREGGRWGLEDFLEVKAVSGWSEG